MSDLSPKERRSQRTRQAILDTARDLIAQGGYEALSMRKIARRIDYSPAGLYEYFENKEDIVAAVCRQADGRLERYMRQVAPGLPVQERLTELGLAYVRFAEQNPELFLVLFTRSTVQPPTPSQAQSSSGSFGVLFNTVKSGIDQGVFKTDPYDAFSVSYACWAFVHGMAMLRITTLKDFEAPYDQVNRWALEKYVAGLQQA
jgi:AcrR family transcriptional regulator